jgi:hypothetical protein
MIVERSTVLPCSPEQCIDEIGTTRLLRYVARPLVVFEALDPPALPGRWEQRRYEVRLWIFGVVPLGRQTIDLSWTHRSRENLELRDNGRGGLISRWDHRITIRPAGEGTLYTDRVEVQAGPLTPLVWAFAWIFFRHRHRRWQRLVRSGFRYGGSP